MDITTAKDYTDIVIEALYEQGVISETAYGKIGEDQKEQIADKIIARSEE